MRIVRTELAASPRYPRGENGSSKRGAVRVGSSSLNYLTYPFTSVKYIYIYIFKAGKEQVVYDWEIHSPDLAMPF